MNFEKEYILENERVILKPLQFEDFQHLKTYAENEKNLWEFSLISANSEERMKTYIERALEDRKNEKCYPFIVFDKKSQSYAGSTRFYDIQKTHQTTQLGYTWYGKSFWGTGLNKNCKYLMLDFAFGQQKFERVEFRADNKNARSIAAMKSIGCEVEGILRNNCASETGRRDSIVLSILRTEWDQKIKKDLQLKVDQINGAI